jgi:hypothetical protein
MSLSKLLACPTITTYRLLHFIVTAGRNSKKQQLILCLFLRPAVSISNSLSLPSSIGRGRDSYGVNVSHIFRPVNTAVSKAKI